MWNAETLLFSGETGGWVGQDMVFRYEGVLTYRRLFFKPQTILFNRAEIVPAAVCADRILGNYGS